MPNYRPSLERVEGSNLRKLRGTLDGSPLKDISTVEIVLRNLRHGVFDCAHRLDAFEPVTPVSPCVFAARVEGHRREVDAVNLDHRRSGHTETLAWCLLTPWTPQTGWE